MTKEKKKKDYRLLIATVVLFIASVAFWVYIGHYARRLSIYNDELLYYSYAQNLVQGRGFPVVYSNIPHDINRYVYSILISPAFLMSNRYHQFQVLALINATIMSSAIIPLALLAKKMLLHFKTQLMALILFVVSADFCMTLFYMADISFFTINIWMFYFAFCIFKEKKKKALYAILFGIFAVLSMLNKRSSVIVIVAFALTILLYIFTELFRKRENRASLWQYVFAFIFLAGFAYLAYRIFLHFEFDKMILTILDRQKEYFKGEDVHIAQRFINYALQLVVASLYLPFALPVLFPERLKKEDRFLLIMVILTFIGFSFVEFYYSFGRMYDEKRVSLRYVFFLFPILQLLFFKVLERSRKKMMHKYQILDLLRWIIVIIGGGYVMVHYQGVVRMSAADSFLLGYIERIQGNSMLPFQILMECILIGGCALFFFSRKFMMIVFTILWAVVQVNNTTYAYNRVYHYRINSRDFASLSQIEYFIKEHKDETFLMLHDGKSFSESGMNLISDTYFNYANTIYTYTATLKKAKGAKKVGLDLNSYEIPIKKYMRNPGEKNTYDCKHVDYIIMSKDGIEELDETQCEIMPESNYMFVIYRLNDPTMIPRIIEKEGK